MTGQLPATLRIGLDLDNTLVTYDTVFRNCAIRRGLLSEDFVGGKRGVRDAVRLLPGGEQEWRALQAHVYGPGMQEATLAEGATEFVHAARARGIQLMVVSHKTERAAGAPCGLNLREAAAGWLERSGLVGPKGIPPEQVYFESTRAEKIARIIALQCTHFVDDLEEVLEDPAFPSHVEPILVSDKAAVPTGRLRIYRSFLELADALLRGR